LLSITLVTRPGRARLRLHELLLRVHYFDGRSHALVVRLPTALV